MSDERRVCGVCKKCRQYSGNGICLCMLDGQTWTEVGYSARNIPCCDRQVPKECEMYEIQVMTRLNNPIRCWISDVLCRVKWWMKHRL